MVRITGSHPVGPGSIPGVGTLSFFFFANFIILIKKEKDEVSPTGNRTRVSHVTGEDTHHYTIEDTDFIYFWTCINMNS